MRAYAMGMGLSLALSDVQTVVQSCEFSECATASHRTVSHDDKNSCQSKKVQCDGDRLANGRGLRFLFM